MGLNRINVTIVLCALFFSACSESLTVCDSNADCSGGDACVDGQCIQENYECESIGAFETVTETLPQHATEIAEFHVTFDEDGAVHYCYFGYNDDKAVSYYGYQTASFDFEEEKILVDDASAVCAGIEIARDGTPYLLSKQPAAVLWKSKDNWKSKALVGFETPEAQSALRGDDTVVTLTRAGKSGVYLSMSLGFQTANQPMYAAQVTKDELTVLFDGQEKDADPTIVGHGPQIVETDDDAKLIAGRVFQNSVVLAEVNLDILAETEGLYPKAAVNEDGVGRAVYLNHNDELVVSEIDDNVITQLTKLGNVYPTTLAPGHLPFEISVDKSKATHLLFEDDSQGENAVVYQKVTKNGETDEPVFLTENLVSFLPGSALYDISTDTCGRASAAFIENNPDSASLPKLRIVYGR